MVAAVALLFATPTASAHGMRSVYVEIVELSPASAQVTLRARVPVTGLTLAVASPCTLSPVAGGEGSDLHLLACPEHLSGAVLTFSGLGPIVSEAVLYHVRLGGTSSSHLITPDAPVWTIPSDAGSAAAVAREYVGLGVRHIASGADHLLFLLALLVSLRRLRAVILAETAFTLSHSLSFSASALGWVHVPVGAAEACIALSLVLLALDIGRHGITDNPRPVAALAFLFGLVHGLGFAGGLSEIGLPATAIPAALIGFAGGVELGQIAFLTVMFLLVSLVARTRLQRAAIFLSTYAVGGIGCFWLLARLQILFFPNYWPT